MLTFILYSIGVGSLSSNLPVIYDEEELMPISALQHLIFCERQWALIHLEQLWEDNILTVKGQHFHERVDTPKNETKGNLRIVRRLRLRSLKLGLTGIADVVEFKINKSDGNDQPYPIEYKRGKPKIDLSDTVQLCAQALCLEEMLEINVSKGALFYGETRKRFEIEFDRALRNETINYIQILHRLANAKKTPPAKYEKKCLNCSLINWCMPTCTNGSKSIDDYINKVMRWIDDEDKS